MKYQGAKQAAAYKEHGPARDAFLEEFEYRCLIPGCYSGEGVAVHEITNGHFRMRAFGVRAAWLPACGVCNCHRLTDKSAFPIARQLAVKLLIDPNYFLLDTIREIVRVEGRPLPVLVTEGEVLAEVRKLLIERKAA